MNFSAKRAAIKGRRCCSPTNTRIRASCDEGYSYIESMDANNNLEAPVDAVDVVVDGVAQKQRELLQVSAALTQPHVGIDPTCRRQQVRVGQHTQSRRTWIVLRASESHLRACRASEAFSEYFFSYVSNTILGVSDGRSGECQ